VPNIAILICLLLLLVIDVAPTLVLSLGKTSIQLKVKVFFRSSLDEVEADVL